MNFDYKYNFGQLNEGIFYRNATGAQSRLQIELANRTPEGLVG